MSRVCEVTGKKPMTGNTVSHAKNRNKRRFLPNLHERRFWSEAKECFVTLRVSSQGARTIDKNGLDAVLEKMKTRKPMSRTPSNRVKAKAKG